MVLRRQLLGLQELHSALNAFHAKLAEANTQRAQRKILTYLNLSDLVLYLRYVCLKFLYHW